MTTTKQITALAADHTRTYVIALLFAAAAFAGAAMLARQETPSGWEAALFETINTWPEQLYRFFAVMTFLGSAWGAALGVAATFALRLYRLTWRLAASLLLGYGLALGIKALIGRERPAELIGDAHVRHAEAGLGFPSAHAMAITVIALTVWPYLSWPWRTLLAAVVIVVAVSRLYLGVHLPLDVAGGVALGVTIVAGLRLLPLAWRRRLRVN